MSIPPSIQPLLDEYVSLIQHHLPDLIGAMYLHGSIALDAFDPQHSDVDFITVINRSCTIQDTNKLSEIHYLLIQHYPHQKMDGCYLTWEDLGKPSNAIQPHPQMNDVFNPASQINGYWVMWWILKYRGIAVFGCDPKTLDITIDWDDFLADSHNNLNTYWRRFLYHPRRVAWLQSDDGVEWVVLGVLRLFYTHREHAITSKISAGEYGLATLPQRWHHIIQEAINIRQNNPVSFYQSRLIRALAGWRFVKYIIDTCNNQTNAK